ncbi:MAG: Ig-like domain-containing protein [Alphaproteobacteria bacterium]
MERIGQLNRTVVIGVIGIAILFIALGLNFWLTRDAKQVASVEEGEAAIQVVPADEGTVEEQSTELDLATETAENSDSAASDGASEPVADGTAVPSFDVVRLSNSGDSVFAGRAEPGSSVSIMAGDEVIGTAKADERGEWVFLPTEPLEPGSHELTLESVTPDGATLESDQVVVLVVPEPGKDVAGQPAEGDQPALAILVPKSGDGGTVVLQKPSVPGSVESADGDLALDSVDYDSEGNVSIGGRARPQSTVRLYLDNKPIGEAKADEEGNWRVEPDQPVDPGVYALRADQVEGADVSARVELPFSRAPPLKDFAGESYIVVQPGNSLWRIARRTLGTGFQYTTIYEANKSQIRDPDLIYPGQIFEVPLTD